MKAEMSDVEICVKWSKKKKKNRGCFIGCCCSESNDDISEADVSSIMAMVDVIDTSIDLSLEVPQILNQTPCPMFTPDFRLVLCFSSQTPIELHLLTLSND